jgi:hypothetical protein
MAPEVVVPAVQQSIPAQQLQNDGRHDLGNGKTQIFLNAFDMFTIGHLAPGQWKV